MNGENSYLIVVLLRITTNRNKVWFRFPVTFHLFDKDFSYTKKVKMNTRGDTKEKGKVNHVGRMELTSLEEEGHGTVVLSWVRRRNVRLS